MILNTCLLSCFVKKRQGQNNQISMSEKFNPYDDAAGFRIEPLKSGTPQDSHTRYGVSSVNRNGENVTRGSSRSPRKELRPQRSFVQRGAAQLSRFSNSVAARDESHFAIANPRWLEDSYNNDNGRQNDGGWSQRFLVKPKSSTKHKESKPVNRTSELCNCAFLCSATLCGLITVFWLSLGLR